ncbi:MAG TPA: copper resistance protein CopC, partial [Actinomycetota bacterium]|nr:copper resistance protein CopC [Actinomycetota bacterium]
MRRALAAAAAAVALALGVPTPAGAHALLASSDPAEGARLDEAPTAITLRFTEAPELALSSISLLDRTGAEVPTSEVAPVPGEEAAIRTSVEGLEEGVYTVAWRVVSKVDGHPTGGTFAFGIGVSPLQAPPPAVPAVESPPASPLEMAGRLIFFVGLGLLVGAAWVGAIAFADPPPALRRLAGAAWAVAVVGLVVLAGAQWRSAGVPFDRFLPTTVGRALLFRAGAIAVAGAALLPSASPRARRWALAVAGLAAAGAMLAHVVAGHAAARGETFPKVMAQWVHFVAVGVWLGGLAALLLGVRGEESDTKARAVRRFSAVALFALAAVVGTGIVRSINEVGSWEALFSTGYGRLVLVKIALILGLIALGAVNRYRNVPAARTSLAGLRRVSKTELVLAVGALGAAAALATLVPPAQVPAAARPAEAVTVSGSDFATAIRARLGVTPALPGPNRFELRVTDYDTGDPIDAERVSLGFSYVGGTVPESRLELRPAGDGVYRSTGSNLSIGGPWSVTALIQRGADSFEIPLHVATLCETTEIPGQGNEPTVHEVQVPGQGSVQGYLIPLGGGETEVHFTFLGEDGRPVRVEGEPTFVASRPGQEPQTLTPEFLAPGH